MKTEGEQSLFIMKMDKRSIQKKKMNFNTDQGKAIDDYD